MAWTKTTVEGYFGNFTTETAVTMTGATPINSDNVTAKDFLLGNQHIFAGINVVVGGSDVVADLLIQKSPDGTNWFTVATVIADTTPNVTGLKMAAVDLTGHNAPYWRLRFNDAGAAVGTSGTIKFVIVAIDPMALIQRDWWTQ